MMVTTILKPGSKSEEITSAFFHCFLGLFSPSKSTRQGRRLFRKTQKEHKVNTEGNFLSFRHKSFAHPQEMNHPCLTILG